MTKGEATAYQAIVHTSFQAGGALLSMQLIGHLCAPDWSRELRVSLAYTARAHRARPACRIRQPQDRQKVAFLLRATAICFRCFLHKPDLARIEMVDTVKRRSRMCADATLNLTSAHPKASPYRTTCVQQVNTRS